MVLPDHDEARTTPKAQTEKAQNTPQINGQAELIALFRLLMREPPPDHDFRTCPICKRYGITRI